MQIDASFNFKERQRFDFKIEGFDLGADCIQDNHEQL